MNIKLKVLAIAVVIITCTLLIGCTWITVVPIDTSKEKPQFVQQDTESDFNADEYAVEQWPHIYEYAKQNSQPVEEVIPLYKSDLPACGEKYGTRQEGEGSFWNYLVGGEAKVLKVNLESKAGVLELDLAPYDNTVDFYIQIGPVVKGQALRDAMPFISFKDFRNQLTFGDVAKAINKYSSENVSTKIVNDSLEGQIITFTGAFTQGESILIVPVELAISKE